MEGVSVDWFGATVECETMTLLAMMQIVAGSEDRLVMIDGRGRHGYNRSITVTGEQFTITVLDLGNGGYPFMEGTGASADLARRIALSLNVAGRVSRIDIACDSTEGWLPAEKRVIEWIDAHPNTVAVQVGDFYRGGLDTAKDGRTWYIGGSQSSRRVRIYEKGRREKADPNWVRVEYQFRPHGRAEREWAFNASLEELANSSRAFVALRATEGLYAPPHYVRPERQPILALARQYGNALREHVPSAWHEIYQYLKS